MNPESSNIFSHSIHFISNNWSSCTGLLSLHTDHVDTCLYVGFTLTSVPFHEIWHSTWRKTLSHTFHTGIWPLVAVLVHMCSEVGFVHESLKADVALESKKSLVSLDVVGVSTTSFESFVTNIARVFGWSATGTQIIWKLIENKHFHIYIYMISTNQQEYSIGQFDISLNMFMPGPILYESTVWKKQNEWI